MPAIPLTEDNISGNITANTKISYPDPFFDLSRNYIPKNIKTLFKFCRTFFYTSSFLRNVVTKLTEYPITDILYDNTIDTETKAQYDEILHRKLKIKSFLIEIGLDYFTYGNAFISTYMKPTRFLKCSNCEAETQIDLVNYKLEKFEFRGTCPSCKKSHVLFTPRDEYVKSIDNFKLVRWAPENIDIEYNPLSGSSTYFYTIPSQIKQAILLGNKTVLKEVPLIFLESLKKKKRIQLDENNLFHFKRPALAEDDMGWGKPIILPALKDIYYLQILKRGNEAIAQEYIVPNRIMFPQNTVTLDPFSMHPDTWIKTFEGEYCQLKDAVLSSRDLTTLDHNKTNIAAAKYRTLEDWDYMLNVKIFGMSAIDTKVNSIHPVKVWDSTTKTNIWKQAKDLSLDDYVAFPINPKVSQHIPPFKSITSEYLYLLLEMRDSLLSTNKFFSIDNKDNILILNYCPDGDFFFHENFVYSKIISIEEISDREVLAIEVSDLTHSYLSAGFINKNTQLNLGKWRSQIEEQIRKWKYDPNHIGVFPIPVGYQQLGGNARALLLTPEMKFLEEGIINSLGVPLEFIKGGSTWTGSSISLRIVENHFITYRELLEDFLNYFLVYKLVNNLSYAPTKLKFQKFKMSDDIQSKNLVLQLSEAGKISDAKLLDEFGYSFDEEMEALRRSRTERLEETIAQREIDAEAQGKAALILAKYQSQAQTIASNEAFNQEIELFQEELTRENIGIPDDPSKIIEKYTITILSMPPAERDKFLRTMAQSMPVTYTMVLKRIQQYQADRSQSEAYIQNMLKANDGQKAPKVPKKEIPEEKTKGNTRGEPQ